MAALDGVTLALPAGRVVGLVGPDGAGKTTLLRLAAGLLRPDEGELAVFGLDTLAEARAIHARIGYMPQRFGLYEDLTVAENLALYADLQGVPPVQRPARYDELFGMTGLGPFTARLAGRLSGGMRQKLGLACTLVDPPELLHLDEPTVGVDPVSRRELWAIVYRLVREAGMTVLVSTAYMDEAERCDSLVLLHQGRILAEGTPEGFRAELDGRNSNTAAIAQGYDGEIVDDFSRDWAADNGWRPPPAELVPRAWFNPNLSSRWFIVPGIIGLLLQVVVITVTALSVAREREQGTFDQLLVTPMRPSEILIGKAIPGVVIGLVEATLILLIAVLWFEVPLVGSLWLLYAGIGLFLLAAVGVGLMISSLSVTLQQGLLEGFLYMVPVVILSGFATPIANMPVAVQYLTRLNPMRYFMTILRGVFLEGAPAARLLDQLWPLAVIGVVTLARAGWLFRARLY